MATYIEPKVHEAYKQCLALGQSGMDISQTVGYMSRSITIDILWNAPSGTATARLQGLFVYPAGAATCKLYAYATPGTTAVRRLLWEGEPEGLDAEAAATDPANTFGVGGRRRMHQDVSGSYRALMYNSQRNEEIKRIAALEATANRFCIRENCVQKSGNNMVVAHRRTGSVRMEINLDPNAQDRFRVYAGAAPNPQDTFFYVNKQDQFGFWNLATGDVMRTIADKYCVSNGADCITRIKPWIGFGGSPPAIGYDQTNPIWLDRHNISCMVPGAILSSVEAGYPFGFPTYNQAGMLYDAG
ncbi:hypothetical protein HYH03_002650 [Edaphochlamys debaryana]|uniref:Uncharacterized protein n=1 Tax=Edaphochlamys debaryana TaxID=47281 RepID=A0A835YJG5_9CHLO|nr:hypothetical protein HYH03_002650 [Edaphochlamys debaryana]|eukprot:KAG2499715.1 hypothetical protein HYH03_002650 [Edaphochlamys debaryana]